MNGEPVRPRIAWWPSVVKPGAKPDHICAAWDFFPTFCEMAGVSAPAGLDDILILPTLTGKQQPKHEFLYWEFHTPNGEQAVHLGDWKGIRFNAGINADAPIDLFNLANDVGETNNVAAKHPDVVQRIAGIMKAQLTPSETFPFKRER
jgi:arylsulfatase A-like enzyme